MGAAPVKVLDPQMDKRMAEEADSWNFDSKARVKEGERMFVADGIAQITVDEVSFDPGNRTRPHFHPYGQILHVTEGEGIIAWIDEEEEESREVAKDDIIFIAPEIWHWHGAGSNTSFTHLAYVLRDENDKGTVRIPQQYSEN